MAKQQKYYVVWEGLTPGIYDDWKKCEAQIKSYQGARYKSFETLEEAKTAYSKGPYSGHFNKSVIKPKNFSKIVKDSIAVDAACEGNPGPLEYQGINPHTGEKLFHMGPYADGTVNLGEFLAIVHALAMLKKSDNNHTAIYSDSITGMAWVRNKKIKTTLERTARNRPIFDLVDRALQWLNTNLYKNPILKWETEDWGENPADFGRK
jgi:ribonuclease HI